MKKITLSVLLIGLTTLCGCSVTPENNPSEQPSIDALASILPGEVPNGGEQVSFEELKNLFGDDTQETTTFRNGLSIKLVDSYLNVDFEEKEETNYDWNTETFYDEIVSKTTTSNIKISDANAEIKVTGLTQADSLNKIAASASASAKVTYAYDNEYMINNELLDAAAYYKEGTAYFSLGDKVLQLLTNGSEDVLNKFYLSLPDGLDEMFSNETGLTLPLLSEFNITYFESLIEDYIDMVGGNSDYEDSSLTEEQMNKIVEIFYKHLFTVTKFANEYLLTVNVLAENVNALTTAILDDVYTNGLLEPLTGYEGKISSAEYNELKANALSELEGIEEYFSHVKLSVVFDEVMVKSVSVDAKYSAGSNYGASSYETYDPVTGEYRTVYESYYEKQTVSIKVNLEFEYSDSVTVTYPDFSDYVEVPMGGGESVQPEYMSEH